MLAILFFLLQLPQIELEKNQKDRIYSIALHDHIWGIGESFVFTMDDINEEDLTKFHLHINKNNSSSLCTTNKQLVNVIPGFDDTLTLKSWFKYSFDSTGIQNKYDIALEMSDLFLSYDKKYDRDTISIVISSTYLIRNIEEDGIEFKDNLTSIHNFVQYPSSNIYFPIGYGRCWGYFPADKQNIKLFNDK